MAYECVPFANQNFLKIECIELCGQLSSSSSRFIFLLTYWHVQSQNHTWISGPQLLVGTQEGHLLVYDVSSSEANDGSNNSFLVFQRSSLETTCFLVVICCCYYCIMKGRKAPRVPRWLFKDLENVPSHKWVPLLNTGFSSVSLVCSMFCDSFFACSLNSSTLTSPDGYVCVHSLSKFQLLMQLKNTKGALFFREDRGVGNDRVLRLCVVLKRKLLIYVWQNHEFKEVKVRVLFFTRFKLIYLSLTSYIVFRSSRSHIQRRL
jgi:hypothetical protein